MIDTPLPRRVQRADLVDIDEMGVTLSMCRTRRGHVPRGQSGALPSNLFSFASLFCSRLNAGDH